MDISINLVVTVLPLTVVRNAKRIQSGILLGLRD